MEAKHCRICGQRKPLDQFSLQPGNRDGRHTTCKPCRAAAARAERAARPPKRPPPAQPPPALPGESWRAVPGMEGWYEVSDLGRVRSVDRLIERRTGAVQITRGRILAAHPAGGPTRPYLHVSLQCQGQRIGVFVHQLVAWAFLGDPPDGYHVHHINGDAKDNRLVNLKYVEAKAHHVYHRTGERNAAAVLCEADVAAIKRALAQGAQPRALARQYAVSNNTIYNIRSGKNWQHVPPALQPMQQLRLL